jgi:hypothetical protein
MPDLRFIGLLLAAVLLAGCLTGAYRQEAGSYKPLAQSRILLMPVDLEMTELTAAGLPEPKAEWTDQGRVLLLAGLRKLAANRAAAVLDYDADLVPPDRRDEARQLGKLHEAVGAEILDHHYDRLATLPSKRGRFEWSLGPRAQILRDATGADYALFPTVRDSYTSTGRALLIAAAAAFTIPLLGGSQAGFVSLVDLETGDVVWFNKIERLTGHLRTASAAEETAATLLADLPP